MTGLREDTSAALEPWSDASAERTIRLRHQAAGRSRQRRRLSWWTPPSGPFNGGEPMSTSEAVAA